MRIRGRPDSTRPPKATGSPVVRRSRASALRISSAPAASAVTSSPFIAALPPSTPPFGGSETCITDYTMPESRPAMVRHTGGQMTTATEFFRSARDFLLQHREDYATAYEGFAWPRPGEFNWALDWFDVIAYGNDRTALHIVEEDGTETRQSFAELAERSNRAANWLRARGVEAEDRVLVMLGNQAELWETALAAMKLGGVFIPATPLRGPADLRDRVERGRVKHVLVRAE